MSLVDLIERRKNDVEQYKRHAGEFLFEAKYRMCKNLFDLMYVDTLDYKTVHLLSEAILEAKRMQQEIEESEGITYPVKVILTKMEKLIWNNKECLLSEIQDYVERHPIEGR